MFLIELLEIGKRMTQSKIILNLLGVYANVSVVSAGLYFLFTKYHLIESLIIKVAWFASVGVIYTFLILVFISIFDEYWVELAMDMTRKNKSKIYQAFITNIVFGSYVLIMLFPILVGILPK